MLRQRYDAGALVFRQGDVADVAYIIESGCLEVLGGERDRVVLSELHTGELVGEIGLLDRSPRTATVRAKTVTELSVVTREQIARRLDDADPIIRLLVSVLVRRLRGTLGQMRGDAAQRHASALPGRHAADRQGVEKIRLESELHQALQNNELHVHYQPIVDLKTGAWAGFEALTRWHHPERGMIAPDKFIALAEETSLIEPIGRWVLETASADLHRFQQRHLGVSAAPPLFVGVNVSARQIMDSGFATVLAAVPPALAPNIKLEVTETAVLDYEETRRWLSIAQRMGFTVALDDFGTGYSGFQHLLELEFHTVKIDRAFVRTMRDNKRSMHLIRGIVGLAGSLGLTVVAEGVELAEDAQVLARQGVDMGQGYWFGKVMTAQTIETLLINGPGPSVSSSAR